MKIKDILKLPKIEIGDEILVGKFKNRKAVVTGFTTDENNQPVLKTTKGDQKLFKPRIVNKNLSVRLSGKHLKFSCVVFFFIGLYGGFINAGIGFIIMLFLHFYNRLNLIRVNATKVVIVLVYTIGAFLTFFFNGLVDLPYGICLGIGTLIGGWNASRFSVERGEGVVKIFLVISAIIIAIKLWFF